jgi:hypothetical protein
MTLRILDTYLDAGLLELDGNDVWFEHITTAADELAKYIAANPTEIACFVYSAINTSDRKNDLARTKVLDILKGVWRTYASVSMGSLGTVQKGIIFDAIFQNAERDPQIKLSVALLLSSTLPYIDLGSEAEVLQPILDQLIEDIEAAAEMSWSLPSTTHVPDLPTIEAPSLSVHIKGATFDDDKLKTGLERASGPSNSEGEETGGNRYWPGNHGQHWAQEFAPLATESISSAIKEVSGARRVSLNTDQLIEVISEFTETYMKKVTNQLSAASHGIELRSRLLWWKEAKSSPTARVDYRSLSACTATALIAFDFQSMLPALAPASVIAFLREAVRSIDGENKTATFADYLTELSDAETLSPFRSEFIATKDCNAIHSFSGLIMLGESDPKQISKLSLFSSNKELSLPELATLLFTELQAHKALENVEEEALVEVDE